jgi:hypothetical protein
MLKHQMPIRTFVGWEDAQPGFLEADLVVAALERARRLFPFPW